MSRAEAVIGAMMRCKCAVLPEYLNISYRHDRLNQLYEEQLTELASLLGAPVSGTEPIEWFPAAQRVTLWHRENRFVYFILERHNRHGVEANLLWCLSVAEKLDLIAAAQSRQARISRPAEFREHLTREFGHICRRDTESVLALVYRTVIDDLQAMAPEKAVALLSQLLDHVDGEVRFPAAEFMLRLEGDHGVPYVLPLLNDPLDWIRWNVIGEVGKYADDSVIDPLTQALKTDPDPGVRGQAAYVLGRIGSPQAIPALIDAIDHDKQEDALGHTPSSISGTALDNILGTNETRIDMGNGFCKMAPWPADVEFLKRQALKLWETWQASKKSQGNEAVP